MEPKIVISGKQLKRWDFIEEPANSHWEEELASIIYSHRFSQTYAEAFEMACDEDSYQEYKRSGMTPFEAFEEDMTYAR